MPQCFSPRQHARLCCLPAAAATTTTTTNDNNNDNITTTTNDNNDDTIANTSSNDNNNSNDSYWHSFVGSRSKTAARNTSTEAPQRARGERRRWSHTRSG